MNARPERVFEHLDDHARLSSHMSKSSWMMGGGRMQVTTDAGKGRSVGSRVQLTGRAFGLHLGLDEVVTVHDPPVRKVWETVGSPRLLIIGAYRMGFTLTPVGELSRLAVWIDYALPVGGFSRFLGWLVGRAYARWCTWRMVADAIAHFGTVSSVHRAASERMGA